MAKDKAAKERKRALKKKQIRVRSQERIARHNKLIDATTEVFDSGELSSRSLADMINARSSPRPLNASQLDLDKFLTTSGLRTHINNFCRAVLSADTDGMELVGSFSGSCFSVVDKLELAANGYRIADVPMSSALLLLRDDPMAEVKSAMSTVHARVSVCLVWSKLAFVEPVAFAVDLNGCELSWVVNTRGDWHRINRSAEAWDWLKLEAPGSDDPDIEQYNSFFDLVAVAELERIIRNPSVTFDGQSRDAEGGFIANAARIIEIAQTPWHKAAVSLAQLLAAEKTSAKRRILDAEESGYLRGIQESRKETDRLSHRIGQLEAQKVSSNRAPVREVAAPAVSDSKPREALAARLDALFG